MKRIQKDAIVATEWVAGVKELLDAGTKLSLEEVKSKLSKVSRVKITCPEYKNLRKAHQDARNWTGRVKKSGLDNGSAQIHVLKELLREHDALIISVPEEAEQLKQALCGYCICRRPYEGFMIGCDECDEWYHGPCIGITQAQGDKMDKYVCVRCSVKRVYRTSCGKVATIIRKWCDPKDLSKARSQDNQKHQRKIREKKREILKWKEECQESVLKMQELRVKQAARAVSAQASVLSQYASIPDINGIPDISDVPISDAVPFPDAAVSSSDLKIQEEAMSTALHHSIAKSTTALEQANRKLSELTRISNERKANQNLEDLLLPCFRYWCAMLRGNILAPETLAIAEKGRPLPTAECKVPRQLLSQSMEEALEATKSLGISDFPDVSVIRDALQCAGWCLFAFDILMKKPRLEDLKCLLNLSDMVNLPEVKSVTMVRAMISRTSVWRAKVHKTLAPDASDIKPFDSAVLKELGIGMSAIPVTTPEEAILCNAIADEGERHCICGGPRDEQSMTCCSNCNKWYHGACLNAHDIEDPENWTCSLCEKGANSTPSKKGKRRPSKDLIWPFQTAGHDDVSAHAPMPQKIWPPFGLADSPEALNALGIALTYKVEDMKVPIPKTPDTLEEIVKKAVSVASSEIIQNPQPASKVGEEVEAAKSQCVSVQNPASPSSSVLASRFPSFGAPIFKATNGSSQADSNKPANPIIVGDIGTISLNDGNAASANQEASVAVPSVATNGETVNDPMKMSFPPEEDDSMDTPMVEGLANGVVQDALMVARDVANSITLFGESPVVANDATMDTFSTAEQNGVANDVIMTDAEHVNKDSAAEQSEDVKDVTMAKVAPEADGIQGNESISDWKVDLESVPKDNSIVRDCLVDEKKTDTFYI